MKERKIKLIVTALVVAILILLSNQVVLAAEGSMLLTGEEQVDVSTVGTTTLSFSYDEAIGAVSGTISVDDNISIQSVSGLNNWSVTYNAENKSFIAYKAEGSKSEEILSIQYTSEEVGTQSISISDLVVTTNTYEEINANSVNKNIAFAESSISGDPSTDNNTSSDETTDGTTDGTVSNQSMPNTGITQYAVYVIVALIVISIIGMILNKKYKFVK